jgi:hypothetical protein
MVSEVPYKTHRLDRSAPSPLFVSNSDSSTKHSDPRLTRVRCGWVPDRPSQKAEAYKAEWDAASSFSSMLRSLSISLSTLAHPQSTFTYPGTNHRIGL